MKVMIICAIALAATPLHRQDPAEVNAYLAALHAAHPDFLTRFKQIVADSAGTPYHDGPLGEGPGAPHDSDPLIDLTRVDCVTFVEQSAALAWGRTFPDVTDKLQHIRYAGGQIDFGARHHFLVADWIPGNPWCREITGALGIETATVTRTISRAEFFRKVKAPEVGQDIPDRDVSVTYIPIGQAEQLARTLDQPALIVFIGHVDWLFALHCGVFLPEGPGAGSLYHASSREGKVVRMDLGAYAAEQANRYLGMAVYAIAPTGPGGAAE
ncbi:MAG: DUF1460 domain-containing protein [Candidatus Hydrogenedentes bacterium]|nr:DUF1460 domain-containing protein [Candidatus Hydrogenedentota bacterium]